MDVKTAFLNGLLQEEVYLEQPLGFEIHERESHVCRLRRALYGLKQDVSCKPLSSAPLL